MPLNQPAAKHLHRRKFTRTGTFPAKGPSNTTDSTMKPHRVPIVLVCLSFLSGCGAGTLGPGISAPPRTLVSIAITPANAGVLLGSLQQFTATGTYSDHT